MFPLETIQDYIVMLLLAAGMGAIGGVVYELVMERSGATGTLEWPGRLADSRLVDLGWLASAIVGAVTAVGLMYFFPPAIVLRVETAGQVTAESQYELVKLVALSLLAGATGPSLLTAATSRILLALQEQKVESVSEAGQQEVQRFLEQAKQENNKLVSDLLGQLQQPRSMMVEDESALEIARPNVGMQAGTAQLERIAIQLAADSAQRLDQYATQAQNAIASTAGSSAARR